MQIGHKHHKSIEQYRHNIKLLKYHLKKEQRINQTLKYKAVKNNKKNKAQANSKDSKPKQRIYSMLETVSKLTQRMKQMGLGLTDIFRMADAQYEGQINKGQFLKVVNQLKADIEDNLVQELFYAIDTNMNGILDENQYLEFLCAYGGADSKDSLKFQRKTLEKFAAQLKKKSIKPEGFLADSMDPINVYDFKKKLESLTLNQNQKMILLKAFDPQNSGHINHEFFIQQTRSIKEKTEQTMKNQEMQKDIKHMCAKWRQVKINPIKIFEQADIDKKDGISQLELQQAFIKLMPQETKFTIKKWVKLINLNNDSEITREEFTNSIRSFYALNQLQKFSSDYQKDNPNARRGLKNEQMPTQKILKKLGQKIQAQKMTKKQAFKAMDINGDGTLTKEELAEGLKKLGFHITDVGRILSVFDRDVSEGVDVNQWCKILGQDVEFEESQSDADSSNSIEKSPKKVEKKVLKNNTTENKQAYAKKQDKTKKPEPQKKTEATKKQETNKKIEAEKKLDTSKKVDESKKKDADKKPVQKPLQASKVKPTVQASKTKPTQKSVQTSKAKPKAKPKQESPIKESNIKKPDQKGSVRSIKQKKEYESEKEQEPHEQEKQVQISEIQREVGIEYKKHPLKVLPSFKKYNQKSKTLISLGNLKIVLKQMKITFNDDQVTRIFEQNIDTGGSMNYKDWLDKIAAQYAEDVEEEKEKSPQKSLQKSDDSKLKIRKTQSKMQSSKSLAESKSKDEKKVIKTSIKTQKIEEKVEQNHSDIPNESDLKSVRSIRSVRSNNPRQQIVAQKLKDCIECPQQMQRLSKEYLPKAAQLKKSKKRFEDKTFPAEMSSITKNPNNSRLDNTQVKAKNLKWKHYSQFLKQPQLFQDGIDPNDILQGGLGNCYFLSALACLAEYPNLIQRLFEYVDIDTGYFLIWLCIDGAWKLFEIDGNIVVNPKGTQPYFTRSRQGQLWVVLLEKAYAKAYGCFQNIVGGDTGNAIRDLTGSSSKYFEHSKVKQQDLWKQLFEANQNKFIMSTGTDVAKGPQIKVEGRQQNTTAEGLVLGHAYSILDIREEKKQKIIQLRNPWGTMEWTGDWSDKSSKWTKQLRQKLNYNGAQDGIFWMPFKDFFTRYKSTNINRLKPDNFYQYRTQHKATNLLIKVSHYELKELFIGISQTDKRHKGKQNPGQYTSVSFVSLVCEEGDEARVLRKVHDTTWLDTKQIQIDLPELKENEEVVLLVKLPKQTDVTVSVYANCKTDFKVDALSDEDDIKYSQGVAFLQGDKVQGSMQGFQFWSAWVGQRVFFCVRNESSTKNKIKVNFTSPNNIDFISPSKQKGEYTLNIQRGQTKSVKAQIKDSTKPSSFGQMDIAFP